MPRSLRSSKNTEEPSVSNVISNDPIPLPPPDYILSQHNVITNSPILEANHSYSQTSLSQTIDSTSQTIDRSSLTGPNINTKIIKLPNFWCASPEAWFMNAELQFNLNNIIESPRWNNF